LIHAWSATGATPANAKNATPPIALPDASAIVPTTKSHAAMTMCTSVSALMEDRAHDTIGGTSRLVPP